MRGLRTFGFALLSLVIVVSASAQPLPFDNGDYVIGPDYAPAPETALQPGVLEGAIQAFVMSSTEVTLTMPYTEVLLRWLASLMKPPTCSKGTWGDGATCSTSVVGLV